MKTITYAVALVFALSLCFATVPNAVHAKTETKKVETTKKQPTVKKAKTAKKEKSATAGKTAKKDKAVKTSDKKKKAAKTASAKAVPKNVNLNTAGKDVLMQLPGIGPVTVDAILKYRKANGKFKSIDDLQNVKGVGEKTLKKLKPYLKKL